MLASLIIVFREVLEAGLIVGIVLAASVGVAGRGLWVSLGIVAGICGAALVAAFAGAISDALQGVGQEVFTASILIVAVCMLGWHCVWMSRHAKELSAEASAVGQAVKGGEKSLAALAVVVAVAVLREGSEVVLFLYGIAMANKTGMLALLTGGLGGVALGALISFLLYRGLLVIPLRHLFSVTNVLVAFLAAGMAGQAAAVLAGVDLVPSGGNLWDSSKILSQDSLLGRTLQALLGYSDRPIGIQAVAYIGTLIVLVLLTQAVGRSKGSRRDALPR